VDARVAGTVLNYVSLEDGYGYYYGESAVEVNGHRGRRLRKGAESS
jgi:hypothetical protein